MASMNRFPLRPLLQRGTQGWPPRLSQRRWARVLDVRFLATQNAQERIAAKYKDKLDQKARKEGHESVDSLKEAYRDRITSLHKGAVSPRADAAASNPRSEQSLDNTHGPPPPAAQPVSSPDPAAQNTSAAPGVMTLSSFLDLDKVRMMSIKEIEALWRLRHINTPSSLCAVIPLSIWGTIHANAMRHPQFILPLPREGQEGAEIHFLQWTFPQPDTITVLFTNLAEYKLRGEYASPHTTITHHLELLSDKDVVLVQGQVVTGRGVTVEESKWLLMCLQKFYGLQGEQNETRKKLLDQFNRGDEDFKVQDLLEEAEKIV